MKTIKLLVTLFILNTFMQTALAIDNKLLKQAREQQQLSIAGDENATEEAFKLFTNLHTANPNSALLLANLGSIETLKGRDAWMPWNKMGFVESGLEKIDKALDMIESESYQDSKVSNLWQSVAVQNVAANTFINLPGMFNRFESGKEELVLLLSSSKFNQSPITLKNSAYALAVTIAKQENRDDLVKEYQSMIQPLNKQ